MLRWTPVFLIPAIFAGLMGYTGIAGEPMQIDRVLFFVFMGLFLATLAYGMKQRTSVRRG